MRISLADSRTKGFKKWSDAQRPSDRLPADDGPEVQHRAGDSARAGVSVGKADK
jgi:hypothetical protein